MPGIHEKVILYFHLSAASLFKYLWPLSGHETPKSKALEPEEDIGPYQRSMMERVLEISNGLLSIYPK